MHEEHPTSTVRARALWLIPGILFAVACAALLVRISLEPRHLGKTAGQWFPFFPQGGQGFANLPGELTTGELETLPVLIAATKLREASWLPYTRYLPQKVASKIPQPINAWQLLEAGREPELALLILTQARELPARVESLVRALAAGESVKNWSPEPPPDREVTEPARAANRSKTLQQFAHSLLASVSQRASHRL